MAARKNNGWIKLYRTIADHEIWTGEPFTRGQAWVDLLLMACFADTEFVRGDKVIHLSEGTIMTTLGYLAKRWNRSVKWVRYTLQILKDQNMIKTEGHDLGRDLGQGKGTRITIENWAFYQGQGQGKGQGLGHDLGQHNKNNKKNKKEKEKEKEKQGADGSGFFEGPTAAAQEEEERFVRITAADGRTYLYDTKEERYVD